MAAAKAIEEECQKKCIKRAADMEELYLAKRNIDEVPNLARFKNLKRLWLNGNKLYQLKGLKNNFHLNELYLQNNMITEINGTIQQLTCLQVLLLHGNQLTVLTDVIHELRNMQNLKVLNLFGNPLAQEYDYRMYVVFSVPTLELLDRQAISRDERQKSMKKYQVERQRVRDSVAFWRRADTNSSVHPYSTNTASASCLRSNLSQIYVPKQVKYDEDLGSGTPSEEIKDQPNEETTEIDEVRTSKRAIMQLNRFGWVDILEARTKSKDAKPEPCIYTTKFR